MDPRAKNCLRALVMLCSTAGLAERDLFHQALCFGNDLNSGIQEADSRGTLQKFYREQKYLSLGLIKREAITCGKISNYFALVFGCLSGSGNSSHIISTSEKKGGRKD